MLGFYCLSIKLYKALRSCRGRFGLSVCSEFAATAASGVMTLNFGGG